MKSSLDGSKNGLMGDCDSCVYMAKIYQLCHTRECCPVVELGEGGVRIGEEGNQVHLKPAEWEALRQGILKGEL